MTECNHHLWQSLHVGSTDLRNELSARLSAEARREALLDATKELVNDAGPSGVTMGAVAERAEVTRALVYKHFDNKDDLLVALYRREAKRLDKQIRMLVEAAPDGFESKLRAFVGATLDVIGEHLSFFTPLRAAGTASSAREDKRHWDSRSVTYFANLAVADFDIDTRTARAAIAVLFSGVPSLLAQMRAHPGRAQRVFLEDTYVDTVIGALTRLATRRSSGSAD